MCLINVIYLSLKGVVIANDLTLFILIIFIIVVIVIAYYAYLNVPTIDCTRYGQSKGLPNCPKGTQNIAGICYYDTWSASDGTHSSSATCHVSYPDCPYVGCAHEIGHSELPNETPYNSLNIPGWDDAHFGPGWYVTGANPIKYCHRDGDYGIYCESAGIPGSVGDCAVGDNVGGICYGPVKCSDDGLVRATICSCSRGVPEN